jgi:hypothetical protein
VRKNLLLAVLAVLFLLVGATACSKKSSGSVSTDTSAAAANSDADDPAADDPAADDSTDEPDADEGAEDDAADDTESASGGDCPTQSEVDALEESLDSVEDLDPANMSEAGDAVQAALDEMASYLPADYDDDVETLREGLSVVFSMYSSIDMSNPTPEQIATIESMTAELDEAELDAASERIESYFTENCPDVVFPE